MQKLKKILAAIGILIVLGAVGGGAYYLFESYTYFSTEDAQITADMITITPEVTGRLKSWDVKEGDLVKAGQTLGRQDLGMSVNSSAMSAQLLSSTADALVSKADIKTPIDGRVVQSSVVKDEVVSPGMEIATIADLSHMYVRSFIEETNIFQIKPGQKVDIRIDAYPGEHFSGYVESIGQATQQAFNTLPSLNTSGEFSKVKQLIPVKINLADAGQHILMPGMNATVKIHIKE